MTFHLSFSSSKSLSGKPSFTISTKAFLRLLNCPPSGEATKRCRPHDLLLQPTGRLELEGTSVVATLVFLQSFATASINLFTLPMSSSV